MYIIIWISPLLLQIYASGITYWIQDFCIYFPVLLLSALFAGKDERIRLKFEVFFFSISLIVFLCFLNVFGLYICEEAYSALFMICAALFAFYYSWTFKNILSLYTIFLLLMLSVICFLFTYLYDFPFYNDFRFFLINGVGHFTIAYHYTFGLFIGIAVSLAQNRKQFIFIVVISAIASIFSLLYASKFIFSKLNYGSFSGFVEEKVDLTFRSNRNQLLAPSQFKEKYQLVLLPGEYAQYLNWVGIQKLYWEYKENPNLFIYIIVTKERDVNICEEIKKYNIKVPVYIAENSEKAREEMNPCHTDGVFCILQKDEIIFRGNLNNATKKLETFLENQQK
ncbi:MAG: hypothetical protein KBH23_04795 [Bacteroidaceae bacterium]|nr:hypothetical protein [Bacteroidaceae bacterium]